MSPTKRWTFTYQAAIVRALGKFVEQDMVYKGKKPGALVHALPHGAGRSGSRVRAAHLAVDLRRVSDGGKTACEFWSACAIRRSGRRFLPRRRSLRPDLDDDAVDDPNNLGIAFHPDFQHGAYDVDGKAVIVAKDLAEAVAKKIGRPFDKLLATFDGKAMERLVFRHPLYARDRSACSAAST